MPRLTALFFFALTALVAVATPAPEPRPWLKGWEKPVDPKGDCQLERKGERLTITLPGKGHDLGNLTAPHLLRDAEGDFVVEVHVSGDSWYCGKVTDNTGCRGAGIVVMEDEKTPAVAYEFRGQAAETACYLFTGEIRNPEDETEVDSTSRAGRSSPPTKSAFLRLERSGDSWRMSYRKDCEDWTDLLPLEATLPRKLKVGVFAEANVEGTFKVIFDRFKLLRSGK